MGYSVYILVADKYQHIIPELLRNIRTPKQVLGRKAMTQSDLLPDQVPSYVFARHKGHPGLLGYHFSGSVPDPLTNEYVYAVLSLLALRIGRKASGRSVMYYDGHEVWPLFHTHEEADAYKAAHPYNRGTHVCDTLGLHVQRKGKRSLLQKLFSIKETDKALIRREMERLDRYIAEAL